jgi:thioredoxin reductase
MMRALIADPELPKKAKDGRVDEIIPCIGCNQGCLGHVLNDRSTSCILNPVISREEVWGSGTLMKSETPKKVIIVGAGPAGIECARICAVRGHEVTLFERDMSIGGQAILASNLPGRNDLKRALNFWRKEIERLAIDLKLGEEITSKSIIQSNPDVVVCATGSNKSAQGISPAFPPPKGIEFLRHVEEISRLAPGERNSKNCMIYDDRGDFQALGWAELSALSGAQTTLVTRNSMSGMYVEPWTRLTAYKRLNKLRVRLIPDSFPKEINEHNVSCFNVYNADIRNTIDSDFTYFLGWQVSRNELFNELKQEVSVNFKVFAIGDCRSPRSIEEAIYEGHELARSF